MSRLKVEAIASKQSLVFQPLELNDQHKPKLYLPGDVMSPGNSIGGFLTLPDNSGRNWGLWRVSGSEKARLTDPEFRSDHILLNGVSRYVRELKRIASRYEPDAIARHRGRYLMALTSGSARRGVLHNANRPSNPLLDLMREHSLPTDRVERVASSDGQYTESYSYLFPRYHTYTKVFSDGEHTILESQSGAEIHPGYNPNYPSGNGFSRELVSVEGSTYVIVAGYAQSPFNIGPGRIPLTSARVLLTPNTNMDSVVRRLEDIVQKDQF